MAAKSLHYDLKCFIMQPPETKNHPLMLTKGFRNSCSCLTRLQSNHRYVIKMRSILSVKYNGINILIFSENELSYQSKYIVFIKVIGCDLQ